MATMLAPPILAPPIEAPVDDPLWFLAGQRYTCYCGRSVVGSILCRDCAEEMAEYYLAVARRRVEAGRRPT